MKRTTTLLVLALACAPAWAINKCTLPGGKVVFQDLPCAGAGEEITVRPASGTAPAVPASASGGGVATADVQPKPKEGVFGDAWRRRHELERTIKDSRAQMANNEAQCHFKQQQLQARQQGANNNLAGATYRQSLAAEMQANATLCETRSRELQRLVDRSQKELDAMNASKP